MIRFLSLFLFQSLFKRVNIAVPSHSLIRTRCRFQCEFSRRRAVLLWTRACKYLRRPSLFPPRTSHPSIFFHAARGNITVHCWNVPCRINSRFHMTSLPRCVPSEGWVCSDEKDWTVSHHSDGAERRWVSSLDTGCVGGVERSATSSTCFSIYSRECTTVIVHLTKWRIWSQLGPLQFCTIRRISAL